MSIEHSERSRAGEPQSDGDNDTLVSGSGDGGMVGVHSAGHWTEKVRALLLAQPLNPIECVKFSVQPDKG